MPITTGKLRQTVLAIGVSDPVLQGESPTPGLWWGHRKNVGTSTKAARGANSKKGARCGSGRPSGGRGEGMNVARVQSRLTTGPDS